MFDRSIQDSKSHGSFLDKAGPVGRTISKSLSFSPRKPGAHAEEVSQLNGGPSSNEPNAAHGKPRAFDASMRVNSLARRPTERDSATETSVQIVSYDEDMKIKYAEHLRTFERLATKVLVTLRVEHPQKTLWTVLFILIFGLSFMAEFLQTLPPSKVAHVARRSGSETSFAIYGWGLPIAKGASQTIKVAAMVLLFPVARVVLAFLRRATLLKWLIPFDSTLSFHRLFGYTLFLFSWIHTFAHVANSINQTKAASNAPSLMCDSPSGTVRICSPYEKANPGKSSSNNTLYAWWTCETSITGILMLGIMCIGYPFAIIRSSTMMRKVIKDTSFVGKRIYNFTWFFFTHQFMTISFYTVVVLHPLPGTPGHPRPHSSTTWVYVMVGVLAYVVDRTLRLYRQATWETTVLGARILPGGVLELKLKRPRNSNLWRGPSFSYKPGQYAHLNVPQISWAEWHPFTITSVPADNFLMFHIKSSGDWTALLHECISKQLRANSLDLDIPGRRFTRATPVQPVAPEDLHLVSELGTSDLRESELSKSPSSKAAPRMREDSAKTSPTTDMTTGESMTDSPTLPGQGKGDSSSFFDESDSLVEAMGWKAPIIHVDGPNGAPAQNYKDYKVLLLVGGNIGVTPFISILRKLLTQMEMNRCQNCGQCNLKHLKHKHVYFFWTVRDAAAVQYFTSTFAAVKQLDTHGVLDIRIHLTTAKKAVGPQGKAESGKLQTPSSLGLTIYPGRPEWRGVFQTICEEYPKDTVGVFCCGPLALTQDLKVLSREYSMPPTKGDAGGGSKLNGQTTKFDFFHEHF
ncbi:hypothetical protein ABBQ38_012861 [Trebouxia sp. C0009 RCD-2024]